MTWKWELRPRPSACPHGAPLWCEPLTCWSQPSVLERLTVPRYWMCFKLALCCIFFFFLNFKRSVLLMDLFIHVFMFPVFPNAGISLNYTSPHCDGDILKALYFSFQIHQSWANMIDEGVSWQSLWRTPTDLIDSSWSWCSELSWKIRFNVSCSTLSFNRERVQSSHQITSVFITGKYYNIW